MQITDHLPLTGSSHNNHVVAISAGPFPALKAGSWFHHLGFCIAEPATAFMTRQRFLEQENRLRKRVKKSPPFLYTVLPQAASSVAVYLFFLYSPAEIPSKHALCDLSCKGAVTTPVMQKWDWTFLLLLVPTK